MNTKNVFCRFCVGLPPNLHDRDPSQRSWTTSFNPNQSLLIHDSSSSSLVVPFPHPQDYLPNPSTLMDVFFRSKQHPCPSLTPSQSPRYASGEGISRSSFMTKTGSQRECKARSSAKIDRGMHHPMHENLFNERS